MRRHEMLEAYSKLTNRRKAPNETAHSCTGPTHQPSSRGRLQQEAALAHALAADQAAARRAPSSPQPSQSCEDGLGPAPDLGAHSLDACPPPGASSGQQHEPRVEVRVHQQVPPRERDSACWSTDDHQHTGHTGCITAGEPRFASIHFLASLRPSLAHCGSAAECSSYTGDAACMPSRQH